MKDVTLISVGWNQRDALDLMLRSYIFHHYKGEPLKLLLFDNGSDDGSKEWLRENGIPFFDGEQNIGHENAVNILYEKITTEYALLVDTDIEFKDNVHCYSRALEINIGSAGEMIDKNFINSNKIKDRVSPWFFMWHHAKAIFHGINMFRDPNCHDWTYDVGSWFTEQLQKAGMINYNILRLNREQDQDSDIVSMVYEKYDHIGKVSWDVLNKHQDRIGEVLSRRSYVQERLKSYDHILLKEKFIYG